jgi:hypothetical protein
LGPHTVIVRGVQRFITFGQTFLLATADLRKFAAMSECRQSEAMLYESRYAAFDIPVFSGGS